MSNLVIISNRLPVRIEKAKNDFEIVPTEGGLATGVKSIQSDQNIFWIGWPGIHPSKLSEQEYINRKLRKNDLIPIFIEKEDFKGFYEGFSNETLWPLCHYFCECFQYNRDHWEAYKRVNTHFRDRVLEETSPDDIIWIHDYQLMLLPGLIREKRPRQRIGFFLHIPFPNYEVFSILPVRRQIIEGLLAADLIGFHTCQYQEYFLQAVDKLTPARVHKDLIELDDGEKVIKTGAYPMGIDVDKFDCVTRDYSFRSRSNNLIISVDRLDYSKGLTDKLLAYEHFLEAHDEWHGRVSLIMVVVPSRTNVAPYRILKKEIDELVGRINARYRTFTWNPVDYIFRSLNFEELVSLYAEGDIALVTPRRDGMNLVAKEYVATKKDGSGVLILSEFAGASRELEGALLVNPYDIGGMANTIQKALLMSREEKRSRMFQSRASIKRSTVHHWSENFLATLRHPYPEVVLLKRA